MGFVMEFGEFLGADFDAFGEDCFGVEFDSGEDGFAVFSFFQKSDSLVSVGFEGEVLQGAEGEEGEHVAAGEGGDEGLLGVGEVGIAEVFGGGGAGEGVAVAVVDLVVAGVFFVGK